MIKYLLPIIMLGSMSFSLPNFWWNFSCTNYTLSQDETQEIQDIIVKLDEYMYRERRNVLNLTHELQARVIGSDIKAQRKCLLEKTLSDFETNVRTTLSSHKDTSDYILHQYYKESYLPNISDETKRNYVFRKWTSKKEVFLTFDDGPYNKNIVKYLKKEDIAATFFLMCSRINPTSIAPYKNPLFSLWGHTMYHDNYDELSPAGVIADMDACGEVFRKHDIPYRIYRPAYGIINDAETQGLIKNNLTGYVWNIDSADWAWDFTIEKAREILDHTRPGDILLFHEWVDLEVFHELIESFKAKWYSFGKL